MRTANVLKATRQIADEALYRSFAAASGGGGGDGPLPATTFTVMVNKGGNDATGDGTDEKPFLTVTKGLAVAGALATAPSQQALVLAGPGVYPENVEIPPFVFLSAEESGQTVVLGTGIGSSVTISPAWAAEAPGNLPIGGVEQIAVIGLVDINFTGVQTSGPIFIIGGGQTTIGGGITVVGDPVNGGQVATLPGTLIGGPTNVTGASLFSLGSGYSNVVNITSTAAQPASWNSSGDILLDIAVTLNATAGMNASATLTGTGFTGSLTLHDGGGGITAFSATSGGIPDVVTLVGGAAAPVPESPLVGLNSTNPTGVAAAAGTVATADGANGITWSPVPGGFPVSTRGLTMSLQPSHGINFQSGTDNVARWYDQAPSRVGQSWFPNTPIAQQLGVLNGHPALVFPFNPGTGTGFFNSSNNNMGAPTLDTLVTSQEFTVGAGLLYTGSKTVAIGMNLNAAYEVFGENSGGNILEMGLAVGISSTAGPGFIQFLAWINDSGLAGFISIDGVNVKGMISAPVAVGVAHTVVLTFNANTGIYALYVDNLAPVTIAGVGPVIHLQPPGGGTTAFFSNGVQNGGMTVTEIDSWCVEQTAPEIAQTIAHLQAVTF